MEAINIFLKKEQEDKLFERKVNDIYYWEYVRAVISCEANSIVSNASAMFAKNPISFKKYLINLRVFKKYFLGNRKCDILFISQPRRVLTDSKYKNNYIDFYIDYLKDEYKILTVEEPTWSSFGTINTAHNFPIYTENIYLTDLHEINFRFKKIFYKFIHPLKYKNILKEYIEIKNIVNGWYNISNINFKKYFIDSIIRLDIDKKYIQNLINKIKPKIIMLHYMPSIFKEMLISECNKNNIPTIEIQHGTITKVDPLVNKCLDVSKLQADNKYIFAFGTNQVHRYSLSIKNMNNIKEIGFPFLEKKLSTIKNKKKKYILIISQSTIGDAMAKFTSDLADIVDKNQKIIFKYHPNELSKDYDCLKKKNIIEIKQEKSIYDLQNESILQIGSYSTSLYEGFAMKIPTLVIKTMFGSIETVDIFKDIKHGVYFIDTPNDVLKYINKYDIVPNDNDISKLWVNDSKDRLLKEIKEIMKGRE